MGIPISERAIFLDGMRGWAAVVVVLCHVFTGVLAPVASMKAWTPVIVFNGQMAVQIFFLISGFALSVRFLTDGKYLPLIKIAAGRYVRLVIPIFAVCLLVYIFAISGLLSAASTRYAEYQQFYTVEPSLLHLFRFSLFDVFFDYKSNESYVPPLWTMSWELIGSFLVIALVAAGSRIPFRPLLFTLVGVALMFWQSYYALFVIGAAAADLSTRGWLTRVPLGVASVLAIGATFAACFVPWDGTWPSMVVSVTLFAGLVSIAWVRRICSTRLSRTLGYLSFPLYLVHSPVNITLGGPLMQHADSLPERLAVDVLVIVVSFAGAYAFAPINDLALRAARALGGLVARAHNAVAPSRLEDKPLGARRSLN